MHIIEQNINVLCNMSYDCHLMKMFKRLVNDLSCNPAFVIVSFVLQNGCVFSLFWWWSNINICCVFVVKHFTNLTRWVDEQGVYLLFEVLDLLMCGG
jgi:hypothetical protein